MFEVILCVFLTVHVLVLVGFLLSDRPDGGFHPILALAVFTFGMWVTWGPVYGKLHKSTLVDTLINHFPELRTTRVRPDDVTGNPTVRSQIQCAISEKAQLMERNLCPLNQRLALLDLGRVEMDLSKRLELVNQLQMEKVQLDTAISRFRSVVDELGFRWPETINEQDGWVTLPYHWQEFVANG